jgi:hemolysin III
MIAAANLADLTGAAPEPSPAINIPNFPDLLDASPRRLWTPDAGASPRSRDTFTAASARTTASEAVERLQDVDGTGGHESWLLSPEANGAGLGWAVASGLGADLGRSQPVMQDEVEELVNTVTHGLGLVLSLAGLYALAVITRTSTLPGTAAGCAAYGVSMVFLYAASTFYHAYRAERGKRVLLLFDYVGIYFLIAGTYTPMVVINLGGTVGWSLLAVVWGIAVVGTGVKIGRFNRFEDDSPLPYLLMSGVWVVVFRQVITAVPTVEFLWVVAGGAFYMGGFGFYSRAERRFFHSVWHVFVLAGSICHFRAVVGCLAAMAS